ncbi:MAG: hypothetical protein EOP09_08040, partial [Proteobacteria bacterium]
MISLIFVFLSLFSLPSAHAQPELIRLGYVQCQACHTSSYGSNLLNGYGKNVRTTLSAFQRENETESTTQSWINASAFFRYLWIDSKSYKDQFLMQSDVGARADLKKGIGVEVMAGLVPNQVSSQTNAPDGVLGKHFVLRRAIADHQLTDHSKVVAGRDFFARSINQSNHTSYLRSETRQGVTDTPSQVRYETYDEKTIQHIGLFGPSGEENREAREYGAFYRYEREFAPQLAAGSLLTYGATSAIRRISSELFFRYAPNTKTGVITAYQHVNRHLKSSATSFGQNVFTLEPFVVPFEWVMLSYEAEWLKRGDPFEKREFQHALRLQTK